MHHAGIVADFEDELRLDQMDAIASDTGDTGRTELGHPGVVEATSTERSLDQVAGGGNARAWFASMHGDPDVTRGEVDAGRLRRLGQPDGIGRGRAEDGSPQLEHGPQSLLGGHRATWNDERAQALGPGKGRPEADERAEAEREEDSVVRLDARRPVDLVGPDPYPPIPGLGGVEPAQRRRAARARRLVQPAVAVDGEGEVGAKRWI